MLGSLSRAQQHALEQLAEPPVPDSATRARAQEHQMPPLAGIVLPPAILHDTLIPMLERCAAEHPATVTPIANGLRSSSPERLRQLAESLLAGEPDPTAADALPFVAAALQVIWTSAARKLGTGGVPALADARTVCPCCGSFAVGGVVRLDPAINNLRYLHCSLCNTQWNFPRVQCTVCEAEITVAYQSIAGSSGAVRAETCDDCHSYLKLYYQEKDPLLDPVADDLATLALDVLVDEAGYNRSGPNLLFVPGQS